MNKHASVTSANPALSKVDKSAPCIKVLGSQSVAIKAGTIFNGVPFEVDEQLTLQGSHWVIGGDYAVIVENGAARIELLKETAIDPNVLGGFHFAPGGNATARNGGDEIPAINPCSVWDVNFRPACGDARGMTLVDQFGKKFWCDIYLLAEKHDGLTSRYDVTIADGNNPPQMDSDESFDELNYETAVKVFGYYDKQLLSFEEFAAAAYGVTEKSSAGADPKKTKLDAARTSKSGVQQAAGNLWVWGHDGDPESPRASIFGGSWWLVRDAGSRFADLGYWPDDSGGDLGARGRSDHLQLV